MSNKTEDRAEDRRELTGEELEAASGGFSFAGTPAGAGDRLYTVQVHLRRIFAK